MDEFDLNPEELELPSGPTYFDLVSRLGDLYVSFRQRYVVMRPDGQAYVPSRGGKFLPLGNRALSDHLNHRYAVCVYAGPYTSKFLCFDVDDGSRESVKKIVNTLADVGFDREKIYVSTSGGKGYHVEIFFDGLMYTDKLKILYDYVCAKNDLDTAKIEFRPTAGMSIKLPLSVHRKTKNVCWYVDRDTFAPIETQDYLMQIQQFETGMAARLIASLPYVRVETLPAVKEVYDRREVSDEELLCGDSYPDIRQEGERHRLMIQIAVHNRYRGLSPSACTEELTRWYRRQNKQLTKSTEREAMTDIDQIVRWAYREGFQMMRRVEEIVFSAEDFRILAAQPVQSRRKVMFYILLCMKKYGHATASANQMSEILGISRQGVIKALNQLQEGRWLTSKRNRCVAKAAGTIRLPNTYFIGDAAMGWSKGYSFAGAPVFDRDRGYYAKSISFRQEEVKLDPQIKMDADNVKQAYFQLLVEAFEVIDLKKMMTKKEFEELEESQSE